MTSRDGDYGFDATRVVDYNDYSTTTTTRLQRLLDHNDQLFVTRLFVTIRDQTVRDYS